jgi:hypothetical protein
MRRVLFEAQHDLTEAKRRIAELEAEQAQAVERKKNAEADILRGIETHVEKLVASKVAEALSRPTAQQWVLSVATPPVGFQPLAPPILPPVAAPHPALPGLPPLVGAPVAPGLPEMRQPAPSSVTDQQIADAAATRKAEHRLKVLAIIGAPTIGLLVAIVAAISSHYSATPTYSTQPVYVQPPPALPVLRNPPVPPPTP